MKRVLILAILLVVAGCAFAQMDMLPQIFRDMPPELQEGLPDAMSFAEYRQLNRNVDFFTMFMSMIVPGYGLFQVEKPVGAWSIVGARAAGYGMMATAIIRQWDNFRDIARRMEIPETDYQFYLTNAFLFGGGVVVNGLGWAFDVLLAYHIAKNEKDFVQYKYGLTTTLEREAAGAGEAAARAQYVRRLILQRHDSAVRDELLVALPAFAASFPEDAFAAEAVYQWALLLHADARDAEALALLLRVAYRYPESEQADDALRTAVRLSELNRVDWLGSSASLYELIEQAQVVVPGTSATWRAMRAAEQVSGLFTLPRRVFADAAVTEAQAFIRDYPRHPKVPEFLYRIGMERAAQLDTSEAVSYLAAVVVGHQNASVWPQAALELGTLFRSRVADAERARIVLTALVERAPETAEGRQAQEILGAEQQSADQQETAE